MKLLYNTLKIIVNKSVKEKYKGLKTNISFDLNNFLKARVLYNQYL